MSEFCKHNTHESHYCGSCIQESFDLRIKNATAEELLQNESVKMLVERLRREIRNGMNHFDDCSVFFEEIDSSYDIDANEAEICNCGAAWEYNQSLEALKPFKKEGSDG